MKEIMSVDRSVTPWLFINVHAPIYHTLYSHYKEQECFRAVYEPIFKE